MNLNEISADIRLRNPWEAIDLGFAMVQKWWASIYLPLAIVTFSIGTLLYWVTPAGKLWIASIVFWWLKPLYDRILLHIISRKLFSQSLTTWQVLTEIPSLMWYTGFFQSLTFRRLSLSRGFNLPIWQLEQLRGGTRSNRQKILHQMSHTQAIWLTIGLVLLEIILWFSLFLTLYTFLPEKMGSDFMRSFFSNDIESVRWIEMLDFYFYVLVVTIVHPFYIAASFALYINRRTQLEAWDIELEFRTMSSRLKALIKPSETTLSAIFIAFIIAIISATPNTSYAETEENSTREITEILAPQRLPAEKSKEVIKETMKIKDLNDRKKVGYWVAKTKKAKNNSKARPDYNLDKLIDPFAKLIAMIIEYGLWVLLGIGLILLFYFREHWLKLLNISKKQKIEEYQAPEVMFGMDVRPDSIPDDIIGAVRKLWQEQKPREALSLLYRGALVKLINQEQVQLQNSHTENDVLRVAKQTLQPNKQGYLTQLTTVWKQIAYAHRTPKESDVVHLLDTWQSEFAINTKPHTRKVESS